PRRVERRHDDRAAELGRAARGRVGVVDRERDAPVRRGVGLVVADDVEARDDVLEAVGRAHLAHPRAQSGLALLEVGAVRAQASRTFAAVSSALSTQTYVFHIAIGGAPSWMPLIAPTSRPRSRAMKYGPGEPGGITSPHSQPNRPL